MSTLAGHRPPVASSGLNQTVIRPASTKGGMPGGASKAVGTRPVNTETRCSRLGRIVVLCCTFASAAFAIAIFWLTAEASNLDKDILVILAVVLLFLQACTGIYVAFTKRKMLILLFSVYCLVNGMGIGTVMALKASYTPPDVILPTTPASNNTTASTSTASSSITQSTVTITRPDDSTTPEYRLVRDLEDTGQVRDGTWYQMINGTFGPPVDQPGQLQQQKNATTTPKMTTTSPISTTSTTTISSTVDSTTPGAATKPTVAPPLQPHQKMAIVYVILWFSTAVDLVASFTAYTLICSIGAEPGKQIYAESELWGLPSVALSSSQVRGASVVRAPAIPPRAAAWPSSAAPPPGGVASRARAASLASVQTADQSKLSRSAASSSAAGLSSNASRSRSVSSSSSRKRRASEASASSSLAGGSSGPSTSGTIVTRKVPPSNVSVVAPGRSGIALYNTSRPK